MLIYPALDSFVSVLPWTPLSIVIKLKSSEIIDADLEYPLNGEIWTNLADDISKDWHSLPLVVLKDPCQGNRELLARSVCEVTCAAFFFPFKSGEYSATARFIRRNGKFEDSPWIWVGPSNRDIAINVPRPTSLHPSLPAFDRHSIFLLSVGMKVAAGMLLGEKEFGALIEVDGSTTINAHVSNEVLCSHASLRKKLVDVLARSSSSTQPEVTSSMVSGSSTITPSPFGSPPRLRESDSSSSLRSVNELYVTNLIPLGYISSPTDGSSSPTEEGHQVRPETNSSASVADPILSDICFVASLLALSQASSMSNMPHQSLSHFAASVQMFVSLPLLQKPMTRVKLASRLLGMEPPAASLLLEDLSSVPVDLICSMPVPPLSSTLAGELQRVSKEFIYENRIRSSSDASLAANILSHAPPPRLLNVIYGTGVVDPTGTTAGGDLNDVGGFLTSPFQYGPSCQYPPSPESITNPSVFAPARAAPLVKTPFSGPTLTIRQRVLLQMAHWLALKSHWFPQPSSSVGSSNGLGNPAVSNIQSQQSNQAPIEDPLHLSLYEIFLDMFLHMRPQFAHQATIVHILEVVCRSPSIPTVRGAYAKALRTLFSRGSFTTSNILYISIGAVRVRVPNLARSVVLAVNNILLTHLSDVGNALHYTRNHELPPLAPGQTFSQFLSSVTSTGGSYDTVPVSTGKKDGENLRSGWVSRSRHAQDHLEVIEKTRPSPHVVNVGEWSFFEAPLNDLTEAPFMKKSDSQKFIMKKSVEDSADTASDASSVGVPGFPPTSSTKTGDDPDSIGVGLDLESLYASTPSSRERIGFDISMSQQLNDKCGSLSSIGSNPLASPSVSVSSGASSNLGRSIGDFGLPRGDSDASTSCSVASSVAGSLSESFTDSVSCSVAGSETNTPNIKVPQSPTVPSSMSLPPSEGDSPRVHGTCGGLYRANSISNSSAMFSSLNPSSGFHMPLYLPQLTAEDDTCFDLVVLMGFVGDLLHESRASPPSRRDRDPKDREKRRKQRKNSHVRSSNSDGGSATSTQSTVPSCSSDDDSASQCSSGSHDTTSELSESNSEYERDSSRASNMKSPQGRPSNSEDSSASNSAPLSSKSSGGGCSALSCADCGGSCAIRLSTLTASVTKAANAATATDGSSPIEDIFSGDPAGANKDKESDGQLGLATRVRRVSIEPTQGSSALASLCPSADHGGAGLGLWMEVSKAVAQAAVQLSCVPDGGDAVTGEYKSVLTCALQLSNACPLLRELVLRRIIRNWPSGSSDNEVVLLEFLATVLGTTQSKNDLIVTDLRSLIMNRLTMSLASKHIKVARNALILADPSRHLIDFLIEEQKPLRSLLDSLEKNMDSHWSPLVRRVSSVAHYIYSEKLEELVKQQTASSNSTATTSQFASASTTRNNHNLNVTRGVDIPYPSSVAAVEPIKNFQTDQPNLTTHRVPHRNNDGHNNAMEHHTLMYANSAPNSMENLQKIRNRSIDAPISDSAFIPPGTTLPTTLVPQHSDSPSSRNISMPISATVTVSPQTSLSAVSSHSSSYMHYPVHTGVPVQKLDFAEEF